MSGYIKKSSGNVFADLGVKNPEEALNGLMNDFPLTKIQAQAILDMRLQRLTGLEREKIVRDYENILTEIKKLREILASPALVNSIIRDELIEISHSIKGKCRDTVTYDSVRGSG